MNLQTSLNILQNRNWELVYIGKTCNIYNLEDQYLIAPLKSVGRVPSGTLDTMFRSVYTPKELHSHTTYRESIATPTLTIILEKQGSQNWGRIEQNGLLAIATGNTPETVAHKLSFQLTEFTAHLGTQSRGSYNIPSHYVFDYQYDLTRVRELFQQFRISALAEQTNMSPDLLSLFMTSKKHPSSQQAQQIEELIQQFGREMLNFSLL